MGTVYMRENMSAYGLERVKVELFVIKELIVLESMREFLYNHYDICGV